MCLNVCRELSCTTLCALLADLEDSASAMRISKPKIPTTLVPLLICTVNLADSMSCHQYQLPSRGEYGLLTIGPQVRSLLKNFAFLDPVRRQYQDILSLHLCIVLASVGCAIQLYQPWLSRASLIYLELLNVTSWVSLLANLVLRDLRGSTRICWPLSWWIVHYQEISAVAPVNMVVLLTHPFWVLYASYLFLIPKHRLLLSRNKKSP